MGFYYDHNKRNLDEREKRRRMDYRSKNDKIYNSDNRTHYINDSYERDYNGKGRAGTLDIYERYLDERDSMYDRRSGRYIRDGRDMRDEGYMRDGRDVRYMGNGRDIRNVRYMRDEGYMRDGRDRRDMKDSFRPTNYDDRSFNYRRNDDVICRSKEIIPRKEGPIYIPEDRCSGDSMYIRRDEYNNKGKSGRYIMNQRSDNDNMKNYRRDDVYGYSNENYARRSLISRDNNFYESNYGRRYGEPKEERIRRYEQNIIKSNYDSCGKEDYDRLLSKYEEPMDNSRNYEKSPSYIGGERLYGRNDTRMYDKDKGQAAKQIFEKQEEINRKPSESLGLFNLSPFTTEDDIRDIIKDCMPDVSNYEIKLMVDSKTGLCRGYSFINFSSIKDSINAKNLIDGKTIKSFFIKTNYGKATTHLK